MYSQAKSLRPLRDGSVWVYRDQDYTTGSTSELRTTQAARTGDVFRETDSDDPSNPVDVRIAANGDVMFTASLAIAPGATPISFDAAELRSPVRVGDQLVLVDQRLAKSGVDVDKDGKDDAADVAAWRTVVGNEAITLPNRADPLTALRVDTTAVFRFLPSAGGSAQTVTVRSSAWYAPGLGLVRQANASTSPQRAWDSEQTLLGYDGGDQGYGYVAATTDASWRAPSSIDHPLTLPSAVVMVDPGGLRLLDLKGKTKAVLAFAGGGVQALGQTAGTAWARVARAVDSNTTRFDFYRLAADGTPEPTPFVTLDPLDSAPAGTFNLGANFASAPGGDLIWTYSLRTTFAPGGSGAPLTEIIVRRHDLRGWVGAEVKIPIREQLSGATLNSALAQPTGLLLTWTEYDTSARQTQHLMNVSAAGVLGPRTVLPLASGLLGPPPAWRLVGTGTDQWALWWGTGSSGSASAHGVRLDSAGALQGTAADLSSPSAAELPPLAGLLSPLVVDQNLTVTSRGWMFAGRGNGLVYPQDTQQQLFLDVRQLDPGTGAPASTLTTVANYRIPGRYLLCTPIVFDRHTLLLTDGGGYVSPVVVWHR
ncbi:MAG: hypothetical protein HY020_05390 [Burkholderiales bacterium]|nr:hypothetical protein [Burkholderiales bacterium]